MSHHVTPQSFYERLSEARDNLAHWKRKSATEHQPEERELAKSLAAQWAKEVAIRSKSQPTEP